MCRKELDERKAFVSRTVDRVFDGMTKAVQKSGKAVDAWLVAEKALAEEAVGMREASVGAALAYESILTLGIAVLCRMHEPRLVMDLAQRVGNDIERMHKYAKQLTRNALAPEDWMLLTDVAGDREQQLKLVQKTYLPDTS